MSDARVAAIVCEGQTDVPILQAVIHEVWPEVEDFRYLQPELDLTGRGGRAGWSEVKMWCERHAGRLDELINPDLGDPIDLLLIAVDVDIAIEAGIANPPRTTGLYETTRLHATMRDWLKTPRRTKLPRAVVVAAPVRAIEAWVIAALFRGEGSPENIADPATWLVEKKKLRLSPYDRKPWKELHRYREFAATVAKNMAQVRSRCTEAERTIQAVQRRRAQLVVNEG